MSRPRWILPLAPWVVAALLGGTLAWAMPRARESRGLESDSATLRMRAMEAEADAALAATMLAEARIALVSAEEARDQLAASARTERSLVAKLRRRIRGMEKRIADLEAAAAATAVPSTQGVGGTDAAPPAPPPAPGPPPPSYCMRDPETDERVCP